MGTYTTLKPHEKIVQQWKMAKAPGWPSGMAPNLVYFESFLTIYSSPLDHWASLEINLNQGSDSTELEMVMSNVPQGKETDVQQGLENY